MDGKNKYNYLEPEERDQGSLGKLSSSLDQFQDELAHVTAQRDWLQYVECRDLSMTLCLVFGPLLLELDLKESWAHDLRKDLKALQEGRSKLAPSLKEERIGKILTEGIHLHQAWTWLLEKDLTQEEEEDLLAAYEGLLKTLLFPLDRGRDREETLRLAREALKNKDLQALKNLEGQEKTFLSSPASDPLEDLAQVNEEIISVLWSIEDIKTSYPYRDRNLVLKEDLLTRTYEDLMALSAWYDQRLAGLKGQIEEWDLSE